MQKSSVKNFVCSFALSLLAVVVANKVFFRVPDNTKENASPELKTQTISLFSKVETPTLSDESSYTDVSAIETLTADIEEDIEPIEDIALLQTLPETTQPTEVVVEQNIQAETIEVGSVDVIKTATAINTDISAASEIVLEKENIVVKSEVVKPAYEETGIVYADISDTLNVVEDETAVSAEVLYTPEDNLIIAENNTPILRPIEDSEEEDIPLLENQEAQHQHIDVLQTADSTQIAMLQPNALVNTIDSLEKKEEENLSVVDLKNATETPSDTAENDSPWVMARGNRFAKNRAVVEHFNQVEASQSTVAKEETVAEDSMPDIEDEIQETEKEEIITNEDVAAVQTFIVAEPEGFNPPKDESDEKEDGKEEPKKLLIKIEETETISEETVSASENQQLSEVLSPASDILNDEGTKVAYDMVQNILIPIPEHVSSDANLVPQLSIVPDEQSRDDLKNEREKNKERLKSPELNEKEKESGLFKNITSWFSGDKDKKDKQNQANVSGNTNNKNKQKDNKSLKINLPFFNNLSAMDDVAPTQIMPAELRLSFQPNRAEISGQTLKWIHAFADNARNNDELYVQVRIDGTSSFTLQQKRLNLLNTIFANRGVDARKISIVFTSREPNSIIIRNIRFKNNEKSSKKEDGTDSYYQQW